MPEPIQPTTADLALGITPETGDPNLTTGTGLNGSESHAREVIEQGSRTYLTRWYDVQAEFVDEPQKAVQDADGLVAEVIETLASSFAEQRRELEDRWKAGSEVSTEDLRQALVQYRSFFQRLLAA